jgi:3-deoxy-manno-octulosonate cytidylyltransferase (CMP-KDO synthetase)
MTRADHVCGTDRVAEVVEGLDEQFDVIVNVQGDEPEIEPRYVDRLVELLQGDARCQMATLACPFQPGDDPADPNAVKVVVDESGRALYFSRSLIPYPRDGQQEGGWLLHLGIYAYRRGFLLEYAGWPPGQLEQVERLEQLRALERGVSIAVGLVEEATVGIDTPDDYAAFVKRVGGRSAARAAGKDDNL